MAVVLPQQFERDEIPKTRNGAVIHEPNETAAQKRKKKKKNRSSDRNMESKQVLSVMLKWHIADDLTHGNRLISYISHLILFLFYFYLSFAKCYPFQKIIHLF